MTTGRAGIATDGEADLVPGPILSCRDDEEAASKHSRKTE
jgi:hypothetical protein